MSIISYIKLWKTIKSSINMNYLTDEDQKIQEKFLEFLESKNLPSTKKCQARVISQLIVNSVYKENVQNPDPDLPHLSKCNKIIPRPLDLKYFNGLTFLWKEGSKFGCHDNEEESKKNDGGEATYVEASIIILIPCVEWYFYVYRGYKKEDLKIYESINQFRNRNISLKISDNKINKYIIGISILLFISVLIIGIKYFNTSAEQLVLKELIKSKNDTIQNTFNDISIQNRINGHFDSAIINTSNAKVKYDTQNGSMLKTTSKNNEKFKRNELIPQQIPLQHAGRDMIISSGSGPTIINNIDTN